MARKKKREMKVILDIENEENFVEFISILTLNAGVSKCPAHLRDDLIPMLRERIEKIIHEKD